MLIFSRNHNFFLYTINFLGITNLYFFQISLSSYYVFVFSRSTFWWLWSKRNAPPSQKKTRATIDNARNENHAFTLIKYCLCARCLRLIELIITHIFDRGGITLMRVRIFIIAIILSSKINAGIWNTTKFV